MRTYFVQALIIAFIGTAFWLTVNHLDDTTEPWDSMRYLYFAYPASLAACFGFGLLRWVNPVVAGIIFNFAQLPVMIVQSGTGPLIGVGVLFLLILSGPPIGSAYLGLQLRTTIDP